MVAKTAALARSNSLKKASNIARWFELKMEGHSDEQIGLALRLSREELEAIETRATEELGVKRSKESAQTTFARYEIAQRQNLQALSTLIKGLENKSQYNCMIGAIRARSEIEDRILTRGQDLGVLFKVEKGGGGGGTVNNNSMTVNVAAVDGMSKQELMTSLSGMVRKLKGMFSTYEAKPMAELEVGEMYSGPSVPLVDKPEAQEDGVEANQKRRKTKRNALRRKKR